MIRVKSSSLRKQLKEYLNIAMVEPVYIERAGAWFRLEHYPSPDLDIRPGTPVVKEQDAKVMDEPGKVTPAERADKIFDFCKHGQVKGLCRKGCK